MAEFQRYQRSETVRPGGVSTARAQGLQSLSNKLQSFASGQHAQADQEASIEGSRAGQAAGVGKTHGANMQGNDTIRGRAFNKAAIMAHAAQIQIEVRDNVAEFERTNQFDAAGFDAQVEGMKKGLLSEIDPMLQPHAEAEINDYVGRSRQTIQANIYKQQMQENLATISKGADGITEDILIAARANDPAMLEKKLTQLTALYDEGVKDGVLDPAKIQGQLNTLNEKIDEQIAIGSFSEVLESKDLKAARSQLEAFIKSDNKDLKPGTKDTVVSKIKTRINAIQAEQNREIAIKKAEVAAREKIIGKQVKDAEKALDNGYQPPGLENLIELTKGTKYESQLKEAQVHAGVVSTFVMLNPAAQEASINKYKEKKDQTGANVRLIERLEKVHNYTVTELAKDGLSLAVAQGIVPQVDPINFADPQSMANRVARIGIAKAHYKQDISPLTAAETDQIAAQFSKMDADQKIGMLNAITTGFGDSSIEVLKQLDKKNYTLFAHAGALIVDGAPEVARLAIMGNEQIKLNKGILPKDADLMPTINTYLSDVFVSNPKHQASIIQTTKAVYAAMAADASITDGIVDTDILDKALEQVTGGVLEIEADGSGFLFDDKYKIQAPARGVTEAMFEKYLGGLRPGDIDQMGGTLAFTSAEAVDKIQKGALVNVGQGKYLVNIGSGFLLNKDGDPFEFEYGVKGKGKYKAVTVPVVEKKVVENPIVEETSNAKEKYVAPRADKKKRPSSAGNELTRLKEELAFIDKRANAIDNEEDLIYEGNNLTMSTMISDAENNTDDIDMFEIREEHYEKRKIEISKRIKELTGKKTSKKKSRN